jgi:hypothetical protein
VSTGARASLPGTCCARKSSLLAAQAVTLVVGTIPGPFGPATCSRSSPTLPTGSHLPSFKCAGGVFFFALGSADGARGSFFQRHRGRECEHLHARSTPKLRIAECASGRCVPLRRAHVLVYKKTHAHRARVTHLPAHTNPARAIHDRRNLAHSRSLCVARRGASARGV